MPMQFWAQAARLGLGIRELPIRLVYNDPTRHFGGELDDPDIRYRHYIDVFESAMSETAPTPNRQRATKSGSRTPCCPLSKCFSS